MHCKFPFTRLRRGRQANWSRLLVREYNLTPGDLVLPLFVDEGDSEPSAIKSMPGCYNLSINHVVKAAKEAESLGIPAIALFPKVMFYF